MYATVIILIVVLILAGIVASAIQQHKERKEAVIREELSKQKTLIDDTESSIKLALQMPVSQQLILVLHTRVLNAHKQSLANSQNPADIKAYIAEKNTTIKAIDANEPAPDLGTFRLPSKDKVIIKYIQAVKKLRLILRSEHQKGQVDSKVFMAEDKQLEKLQLRVNVETLNKRANDALKTNMAGSARTYCDKAIVALKKQNPQDEYTTKKIEEFEKMQKAIDSAAVKNMVQEQAGADTNKEDIDSLFAPKKKW